MQKNSLTDLNWIEKTVDNFPPKEEGVYLLYIPLGEFNQYFVLNVIAKDSPLYVLHNEVWDYEKTVKELSAITKWVRLDDLRTV